MFYRLDRERSGFVVATDLQRFISTTSPQPLSAEEAASLVRAMDRDADGRVSFLEWAQWLTTCVCARACLLAAGAHAARCARQ